MSAHDPLSATIDWELFLKDDGSLPYVPGLGMLPRVETPVVTTPGPKRSAVAPRRREGDIIVEEMDSGELMGITNCVLMIETRWSCPRCGGHFRKPGRHNGVLRTCRCGARYFLRMAPMRN